MSELHARVGTYATHALAEAERHDFEAHQVSCESCRRERQEFEETLAELTVLDATPPPVALRGHVLAAVRVVRPLPPADGTLAPVISFERAARRRRRPVALLTAAVAAALVAVLSLGVWVHSLTDQHRTEVAAAAAEDRLLSAPDARIYATTLNGSTVSYVVSRTLDQAMLIGADVPDPGANRDFQLWRITGRGAEPAGLVRSGGAVHQWFEGSLDGAAQLAVTLEPTGGSSSPTLPTRSAVRIS